MAHANQSDELTAFYQAYRDWVNAGADENKTKYGFMTGLALCGNLRQFCFFYGCFAQSERFIDEMTEQFGTAGLSKRIPFNRTISEFYNESEEDRMHLNTHRWQWVLNHC